LFVRYLTSFWCLLSIDSKLLTHSSENNDIGLLLRVEKIADLLSNFSVWQLNIILKITTLRHQGEEIIIGDIEQLVFDTGNVRDIHVVGGWAEFFELLLGEDIDSDEMDLGVTVLTGLGGRHVDNLARAVLDTDETVLSQGRTLHGVGGGCTSIGGIEGVLMLRVIDGVFSRHLERILRRVI